MKFSDIIIIFGILVIVLLSAGCTGTSPAIQTQAPVQAQTSSPATAMVTPSPTPAPVLFPTALAPGEYYTFGTGDQKGKATVYRYEVKPTYNWTAPSFNSPREQTASSGALEVQYGYNNEKPAQGNEFLFIYVRVINTGNKAVYAPSAKQFVVNFDGKAYNYTSVHSSDVVIANVSGTQYDYQIGKGGVVGYVQPGDSNSADGYLIYEVPVAFSPEKTYVLSNLDFQNQAVWKLG